MRHLHIWKLLQNSVIPNCSTPAHWILSRRISKLSFVWSHWFLQGTKSESYKSVPMFSPFWACNLIPQNKDSTAAHRAQKKQHTKQAIQFIPVHDIQNLQCQSSAIFYSLWLAKEEQEKLRLCQGYMSWFCSPCMASQLLRTCRHRRRICVSRTAQGFLRSIRSCRSPTNCQRIYSVMHLTWVPVAKISSLMEKDKAEARENGT